jgi:hypothetical protein
LETIDHSGNGNGGFVCGPIDLGCSFWIGEDTGIFFKRNNYNLLCNQHNFFFKGSFSNLRKYLSLLDLNAMKLVFWLTETRSPIEAQLTADVAILLAIISKEGIQKSTRKN